MDAKPSYLSRVQTSMRILASKYRQLQTRDGYENQVTGAGTARSKASAGTYTRNDLLAPYDLETLFQDNDLAYTIVTKPVEDSLRAWCTFERRNGSESDADEDAAERLQAEMERLNVPKLVSDAAVFGRLLGGAGLVLAVRGSGALNTPLDEDRVTEVEALYPFDRQDMSPVRWYSDGSVEVYLWTQQTFGGISTPPVEVHESRLLVFPGATTTPRVKRDNQGWDVSVLQRVYATLASFDGMFKSCDAMFADASQAVFKLQGLIASLAEADGTGANAVATRLAWMDMTRSTDKAIVLDAGDETGAGKEEFDVVDRSTIGAIAPVIQQYYIRLAAAARMPLTVLLGMSPSGMSATGESDLILYYNNIDIDRRTKLQPRIERLLRLVARSMSIPEPDEWTVVWPELARPSPLDVATGEKMAVDSLVALITSQVIVPEEAALNLSKVAPSLRLQLDLEPRRAALEEALEEIENRQMTGTNPEPEPMVAEGEAEAEGEEYEGPDGVSPPTKASERKTPAMARGRQA